MTPEVVVSVVEKVDAASCRLLRASTGYGIIHIHHHDSQFRDPAGLTTAITPLWKDSSYQMCRLPSSSQATYLSTMELC